MIAFRELRSFTEHNSIHRSNTQQSSILQRNDAALSEIWQKSTQRALCLRQFHFATALTACFAHPLRGQSNGRC
jgi:hypothetical protein